MFHPANVVRDLNRVANHVLVFQHDVKSRDHIPNKRLRPEAHGEAGETCKCDRRGDIDMEFA